MAFGVVAGGLFQLVHTGRQFSRPLKVREELLIADGLCRRFEAVPVRINELCFPQQPGFHHLVHPPVDAGVKLGAVRKIQPQHQRAVGPLRREGSCLLFAQLFAGGTVVFQRTQHPYLIVRVDGRRRFGVGLFQLLVHGSLTLFGQFCSQLLPQPVRRFFGGEPHPIQKALDIQPCAAHQDGQLAAGGEFGFEPRRQRREVRHAEGLVRFQKVHRVVRDAVGLFGGHLGGADIKALVDLHRIRADDLAAKPLSQRDAQRRFAGGRRADHREDRMFFLKRFGQTAFPAPFGSI